MKNWMNTTSTRRVLKSLPLIAALLVKIISAKVNLTTEGNVTLVGPHCPGTVRIFCEAIGQTFFRWAFNDGIIIRGFLPDSRESAYTPPRDLHQSFVLLIELTNVVQNTNRVFGNFSSILTVDLSKLEEQNIVNISCGSSVTTETVPVGVTIIKQVIPDSPNITEVTATYVSAGLISVILAWNAVPTDCIQYGSYITYIASLNGSSSTEVNGTMCKASVCSASLKLQSDMKSTTHQLTLFAMNSIGSSNLVKYPISIDSHLPARGIIMITLTGIFIALSLPLLIIMFTLLGTNFVSSNKVCSLKLGRIFQTVSVVLCATCILLLTIAITLITIVGAHKDAVYSIEWQKSRDGLLSFGLLASIIGFSIIFILLVVVSVEYCRTERRDRRSSQPNEINELNESQSPPQKLTVTTGHEYEEVSLPKETIQLTTDHEYDEVSLPKETIQLDSNKAYGLHP